MKLLSRNKEVCTFEFGPDELQLLFHVLRLYPCTPPSCSIVSKFEDDDKIKESQELLDEALAEQKVKNKKLVEEFVTDENRFRQTDDPQIVTLTETEIDWLLQVLNDIRVGLWLKLGSPDQGQGLHNTEPDDLRDFSLMQLSGEFQGFFLYALNSEV